MGSDGHRLENEVVGSVAHGCLGEYFDCCVQGRQINVPSSMVAV
jgi:hypothetical protein